MCRQEAAEGCLLCLLVYIRHHHFPAVRIVMGGSGSHSNNRTCFCSAVACQPVCQVCQPGRLQLAHVAARLSAQTHRSPYRL